MPRIALLAYFAAIGATAGLLLRFHDTQQQRAMERLEHVKALSREVPRRERDAAARELHDVVAYHLSVISLIRNSVAESDDADELASGIQRIRRSTATVVDELRALTEPLLRGAEPLTDAVPSSTFATLRGELEQHGFLVEAEFDDSIDDLESGHRATLCRLLQESVTNILRHAAPGTLCTFTGQRQGETVELRIRNRVSMSDRALSTLSLGLGLRGLRERLHLLGGTFAAGPIGPDWVVVATLPSTPPVESTVASYGGARRAAEVRRLPDVGQPTPALTVVTP